MTHALLKSLRSNPYMRAVPTDEVPPTKRINFKGYDTRPNAKWLKPVSVVRPALPAVAAPADACRRLPRKSRLDRNERARMARTVELLERQTRGTGKNGRRTQGALKSSGVEIFKEMLFEWLNMKSGALFPSHETIAKQTGWSVSTVKRALNALAQAGLIRWLRRSIFRNGTWRRTSNAYQLVQSSLGTTVKIQEVGKLGSPAPLPSLTLILRDVASRVNCNLLN